MSSIDLAARAGITYRQLDHWYRLGYLSPDGTPPPVLGSGTARDYTEGQTRRLLLLARLVSAGVKASTAAGYARQMVAEEARTITLGASRVTITIGL